MGLLIPLALLLLLGGFISMTRSLKGLFLLCLVSVALVIFAKTNGGNGADSTEDAILCVQLMFASAGVFVVFVVLSNLDDAADRRAFLWFIFKYGIGYVVFTSSLKLILFLLAGSDGDAWAGISAFVFLLPGKIFGYLAVIFLYHVAKSKIAARRRKGCAIRS